MPSSKFTVIGKRILFSWDFDEPLEPYCNIIKNIYGDYGIS